MKVYGKVEGFFFLIENLLHFQFSRNMSFLHLFFLSDFEHLLLSANFLSYLVLLTPTSVHYEILGIIEDTKTHLVSYPFSFIYYHNV